MNCPRAEEGIKISTVFYNNELFIPNGLRLGFAGLTTRIEQSLSLLTSDYLKTK